MEKHHRRQVIVCDFNGRAGSDIIVRTVGVMIRKRYSTDLRTE